MKKRIVLCVSAKMKQGTDRLYANKAYSDAIDRAGGILCVPTTRDKENWDVLLRDVADAVLFQGGCDISPSIYNGEPSSDTKSYDTERDKIEIHVMSRAVEMRKPILAICRGMQLLNVVCGGTLHEDLPPEMKSRHDRSSNPNRSLLSHTIDVVKKGALFQIFDQQQSMRVNSMHHQGILQLGKKLNVEARSTDGLVEAIALKDFPYCIGVQWHPEELIEYRAMQKLFQSFIDATK